MLINIKFNNRQVTPRIVARAHLKGGLLYSRIPAADLSQEFTRGDNYSRTFPEKMPPWAGYYGWVKKPRGRISRPARRTQHILDPPLLKTHALGKAARAAPEGFGLPYDSDQDRAAQWELKFVRETMDWADLGDNKLKVCQYKRAKFKRWSEAPRQDIYQSWPHWSFRSTSQQNVILSYRDYLHREGVSPLGGGLPARPQLDRKGQLNARLLGLIKRRRQHIKFNYELEVFQKYRKIIWGKRRRRLSASAQRYYFFQRRRLRGYLGNWVSRQNYFQKTTRRGIKHWRTNRWSLLERATLLGAAYYESRSEWDEPLRGSRVSTPLEYRLVQTFNGFFRLTRRRRLGSRRDKLGKDPHWGPAFIKARNNRWNWFKDTPLGSLSGGEPAAGSPPLEGRDSLQTALYWSTYTWGRSRWTNRPSKRAANAFVWAIKGGYSVDRSGPINWGTAGAAPAGVLLSLVTERELGLPLESPIKQRRQLLTLWDRFQTRLIAYLRYFGFFLLTRLFMIVDYLLDFIWWPYFIAAESLLFMLWFVIFVFTYIFTALTIPFYFISELSKEIFIKPFNDFTTYYVKDSRFVRTINWIWTSWLLVYGSDDIHDTFEDPPLIPNNEDDQDLYFDEVEDTQRFNRLEIDEDLSETYHTGIPAETPFDDPTSYVADFEPDVALIDSLEDALDDFMYWCGFFCQPFFDFLINLPVWAVIEAVSLSVLTIKLEYQRQWTKLLNSKGGPSKGRWYKIPLITIRIVIKGILWVCLVWFFGSQLPYSVLRIELVCGWGLTWHEEYYLAWWVFATLVVSKICAPRGIRNFLFEEIGWSNLIGLFSGAVEVAEPEEYYPERPTPIVIKAYHRVSAISTLRQKDWDVQNGDHFLVDQEHAGGFSNIGYDDVRLILAHRYAYGDTPNWDEVDECQWFQWSLHLNGVEDARETNIDTPYRIYFNKRGYINQMEVGFENERSSRAWREPHLSRNNLYRLNFQTKKALPYGNRQTLATDVIQYPRETATHRRPERVNETSGFPGQPLE